MKSTTKSTSKSSSDTGRTTRSTTAKKSDTATVATETEIKAPATVAEAPVARQAKVSQVLLSFEQIARKAYEIWERNGRVHGRDREDWLKAEEELKTTAKN